MNREQLLERASKLEHFVAADPLNPQLRRDLIGAYHQAGEQGKARASLQDYEAAVGSSAELLPVLGHIELAEGNWEAAQAIFQQLVERDPLSAENHFNLAYALYATEVFDQALQHLARATSLDGTNVQFHHLVGLTLDAMGRPHDAIAALGLALTLDNAHQPSLLLLGHIAIGLGEFKLASDMAEMAIASHSASGESWALKGQLELVQMDPSAAIKSLRQSLDLDSSAVDNKVALAQAYLMAGVPRKALAALPESDAKDNSDDGVVPVRAWAQLMVGDIDAAYLALSTKHVANPKDASVTSVLSVASLFKGRVAEAVSLAELVLRDDPADFVAQAVLTHAAEAQGDPASAQALLRGLLSGHSFGSMFASNSAAMQVVGQSKAINRLIKRSRRQRGGRERH